MEYFNISVRFTSFRVSETDGPAVKVYDGRLRRTQDEKKKVSFITFFIKLFAELLLDIFLFQYQDL